MPVGSDDPLDARFASLDANAIIELAGSLADYGEAGGLSRDLMMQVGRYAELRHGDDGDVMLAIARMYLLGGEAQRARDVLLRAGDLGLNEGRVLSLLSDALALLDDPRTAEQALRDARSQAWGSHPPNPPGAPIADEEPAAGGPRSAPHAPELPALRAAKRDAWTPTKPIVRKDLLASGKATTPTGRRESAPPPPLTRMPGHGPSRPTTPLARPNRSSPQPMAVRRAGGRSTPAFAAARAPDEALPAPTGQIRTEVSRRVTHEAAPPPESDPRSPFPPPTASPHSPHASSIARTTRIRPLDSDDPRRWLDPYELLGEIASGGMATVFLGRLAGHGGFSRLVAIKQLHPHLAHEEPFVQMFLDEARLAAGIHHPHVVPILEVGMSKAGYFLVMEFIEGDTLSGLTVRSLQRGAILPAPVTVRIVLDALAGLHAAHQLADADGRALGLVHRDCTPQNVLVGIDGSARITDFGVARAASRLAITRPHQVKGKVGYLSPEQAHAMDLDRRSDVFTMGIVLWEGLAGRPLFQADTEAATLTRLISAPIPSVRSFVPDVPVEIDEVCRRALHRDRSRRFRTAAEMAEALELAAQAEGFPGAASPRELGRFVESTMGADLAAQREAVRAWLAPSSGAPRTVAASFPSKPPASMRGPASASREGAGSEPRPPADNAPETPAPVASKAPQPTALPPPPPEATAAPVPSTRQTEGELVTTLPAGAPAATSLPPAEPTLPSAVAVREPEAPRAAPPPRARLAAILQRATSLKLSNRRGVALTVLLVIVATSPLWLRAVNRALRGRHPIPTQTTRPSRATAAPSKPQPAWDEGDWLPEAGVGQDDPPPPLPK